MKIFKLFSIILLISIQNRGQSQTALENDNVVVKKLYESARTNSNKNPEKAKDYLYQLVAYVDSIKTYNKSTTNFFIERKATALHFLSYFERRASNYESAIELAQKSIDLKLEHGLDSLLASSYLQKAKAWQVVFSNDDALELLYKADSTATELGQKGQLLEIYSSYGATYRAVDDTINAKKYYHKSVQLADSIGTSFQKALAYANFASFLRLIGEYEENLPYLQKAIALHKANNNKIGLESGLYALGLHYNKTGKPEEAIHYLEQAISLSKELNSISTLPFRYRALAESYKIQGNFKKAYDYQKQFKDALDKRNNLRELKRMAQAEKKLQYEKKKSIDSIQYVQEKKVIEAKAENEILRKKLYLILLIVTLILAVIIGYYSIRYFKIRWKKAEEVKKELNQLLKSSKQNSEIKMSQLHQDIDGLNGEIISKKEEIAELMTESLQHLKSKEKLVVDLKKLASNDEEISVQSIIADLKSEVLEDSRIQLIKNDLETLNHEFLRKIKTKHPNLTKTDLEICSYLKMSLGRQEIAKLRFTTLNAIKKTRNRLRKKMKLSLEDDLDAYIKSI